MSLAEQKNPATPSPARPSRYLLPVAAAVVLGGAGLTTPSFATVDNAFVVLRAASITGIVAVGMSFVTISGNLFSLSSSQLAAFLAVLFALFGNVLGFTGGLCATLVAAAVAGTLQGMAINTIGNPIITTLAFGAVFRGLAALFSGNSIVRFHSADADWLGTARPLGIPTQSWAFVTIAVLAAFTLRRTRLGRLVILSGANRDTAAASGLRTDAATIASMSAVSLACALIGIFQVSQFAQAKADLFSGSDFDFIAAVLVGGVALRGGRGSPLQAAVGAVIIALLQNFMLLRGLSAGTRMTVVGGLVVAATSAFHLRGRRKR